LILVEEADVIMVIGANPMPRHPVFASRMKKRLRQGAKLIVVDPRRTETVEGPHYKAAHHLALTPGTNVAVVSAMAHVIVTEKLYDEAFIRERCDWDEFQDYAEFISAPNHSPKRPDDDRRSGGRDPRRRAALCQPAAMRRSTTGWA
jgi:formate dehydrogenase major subunit